MTSPGKDDRAMSEASERYATDDTFREVADLLFGGGSDLIYKAEKPVKETPKWQKDVALATNTAGAVAGPAAIYQAVKGRKTGGMPRDAMRSGKLGPKLKNAAGKLDTPGGKKAKIAAGVAGGSMVGLQVANMAGDTIAARMISQDKKRDKQKLAKGYISKMSPDGADLHVPGSKGQLQRGTLKAVAVGGKKAKPHIHEAALKAKPKVKQVSEKLVKKSTTLDVVWEGEISKVNQDKRQVFGWASIVEINGEPVVDLQGDYISIDEVEKSAYEYVHKSRKGGDMHLRDEFGQAKVGSHMIESFVITDEKKKALGMPDDAPTGWWVGYQVNDDELWSKVKNGERTGFSIHGTGMRTPA